MTILAATKNFFLRMAPCCAEQVNDQHDAWTEMFSRDGRVAPAPAAGVAAPAAPTLQPPSAPQMLPVSHVPPNPSIESFRELAMVMDGSVRVMHSPKGGAWRVTRSGPMVTETPLDKPHWWSLPKAEKKYNMCKAGGMPSWEWPKK